MSRLGDSGTRPFVDDGANQPTRSATRSTEPEWLYTSRPPDAPRRTTTVFGTARPGCGFRLEAIGRFSPVGHTVT